MPPIKSIDQIAKKWATVTPGRAQDYALGVEAPRVDWATAAAEAEAAQHAGVQAAIANRSFAKGIARVGTGKWKRGCLTKGVQRWGPGVQLAQEDYKAGFAPYRDIIANLNLPPRGPRGDPKNIERVRVIAEALHKHKMGMGA